MRAWLILIFLGTLFTEARDFRGALFIGFTNFVPFEKKTTDNSLILISPRTETEILWDELVPSWNFRTTNAGLVIEARAIYPGRETKWFCLGKWAKEPKFHPRESVPGQADADGRVDTDTLKLKKPAQMLQVRLTFHGTTNLSALKFLGLSFRDRAAERVALEPHRKVWGKTLAVKERSQTDYPEGISEWCSPTATSMLLSFWAAQLHRPELDYEVPEVARAVNDPNWPGTGNWPFNTAFAGAHEGIRAFVTRFTDLSELEQWIDAGVPVAVSVAYGFLKGEAERANGHLVVCIGFDQSGHIIVNDPGRRMVRQTYTRENFTKAWAESGNTVYLVYPENFRPPENVLKHW